MSRTALFIPCYVDQLYPQVGLATLRILRKLGMDVEFPQEQTCCGQPMANSGCAQDAAALARRFVRVFRGYDQVVAPSASCVSMVRNHYADFVKDEPGYEHLRTHTFELCEFLTDVAGVRHVDGEFAYRVGLHMSCHGLRELGLARPSEQMAPTFNKVRTLLEQLRGIQLMKLERPDECCGFGGTFAVNEEAVSVLMGRDRIADHEKAGVEVIAGFDMSCLMHMEGLIQRDGRPLRVMHVAEILETARMS